MFRIAHRDTETGREGHSELQLTERAEAQQFVDYLNRTSAVSGIEWWVEEVSPASSVPSDGTFLRPLKLYRVETPRG